MSSLELTNQNFIELAKRLAVIVQTNLQSILIYSFTGFLIGLLYSTTLTPQFTVTAVIKANEESPVQNRQESILGTFLGSETDDANLDSVTSMMFSKKVASEMWDMGYSESFFKANYDESTGLFQRNPTFGEKIHALILGYEINTSIDSNQLKAVFKGSVKVVKSKENRNHLVLYSETSNPQLFVKVINDLMIVSDDNLKKDKLSYATKQAEYLAEQVGIVKDREIKNALLDSIKQKTLEIALLSNDLPYNLIVVDSPYTSTNPISPSLAFIFIFSSFIGLFLCLIKLIYKEIYSK